MSILQVIANNPDLLEAVKAEVLQKFDDYGKEHPLEQTTDEQLGQSYRAKILGKQLVAEAFRDIARHKAGDKPPVRQNLAR